MTRLIYHACVRSGVRPCAAPDNAYASTLSCVRSRARMGKTYVPLTWLVLAEDLSLRLPPPLPRATARRSEISRDAGPLPPRQSGRKRFGRGGDRQRAAPA
jgi:hypothetical protein